MSHIKMPRFDSINVIPLIDVILVLLAIVLTTASFIAKDNLKIELPETESTQAYTPAQDEPAVYFHIDQHNQIFLNEVPQSLAFAKQFLTTLNKSRAIVLQVDKRAEFGHFVALVDALKAQSLTNLTILTKAKSPTPVVKASSDTEE